jgi:hypothetical protein
MPENIEYSTKNKNKMHRMSNKKMPLFLEETF